MALAEPESRERRIESSAMNFFFWLLFIIAVILWISSEQKGPPPAPPGPTWLKAAIQIFGIAQRVIEIHEADAAVVVTQNDGSRAPLNLKQLSQRNGLLDASGNVDANLVEKFNRKIQTALVECSRRFQPNRSAYGQMVGDRLNCMASAGFDVNDRAYIGARF
jgi:hypothetical protein